MSRKTLLQVRHNHTGLITTCNEYLKAFDSNEFRKVVVILKGSCDTAVRDRIPADEVIFLGLEKRQMKLPALVGVYRLFRLCREQRVDLVLAHRYKPAAIMALVSFLYHPAAMIAVVHKNYQFNTDWRCLIGRWLLGPRFKFVGVSEATREHILTKGIARPDQVMALPNCIDVEVIRGNCLSGAEARRFLGLDQEDFVIGTVGRLSPVKDHVTLLRAFAACRGAITRAKLVVAGDGRLQTELKHEAAALGLGEAVVFAGHVPDAYRIMPAFDVFALTSVSEALPRVLLEAMTCGLPVVATEAGGIPEVVRETAPLYECGDSERIGAAFTMYYGMSAERRQEVGRLMAARVESHFSKQAFRERLRQFLSP